MPEQYKYYVDIFSLKEDYKYTTAISYEEAIRNIIIRSLESDKKFVFAGLVYYPNQLKLIINKVIKAYNKGDFQVKQLPNKIDGFKIKDYL